ncbi:MAG: hypothetical protein IJW45_08625 [Oscillospiraceae bacterium]|nr:hypothetical protein [Oscillospiraceae bacterium]
MGRIQIRGTDGNVRYVRGVLSGDQMIVQIDHSQVSMEQLADHEAYHAKVEASEGLLNHEIRQHIIDTFSEEEFTRVVEKYIISLRGVYDVGDIETGEAYEQLIRDIEEEVFADAYAGINAFGAGADRFTEAVNERMDQLYMGKIREQDNGTAEPTGPPKMQKNSTAGGGGERYSSDADQDTSLDYLQSANMTADELQEGEAVAKFIQKVGAMIDTAKRSKRKMRIGTVSQNHADLISKLMQAIKPGFSADGYDLWLDGTGASHIESRHGEFGKQDHSMESVEAKMLIPWASQNADSCDFILDGKGRIRRSSRFLNSDGSRPPEISMEKSLGDDTVYVSECVPDSGNRRIWITSAYIKKGSTGQKLNMEDGSSPQPTPEAIFDSSATTDIVATPRPSVKDRFSYAGERVRAADLDALELAKEPRDGVGPVRSEERYSVDDTDSRGNELSSQQQEYFRDSQVRDELGKLLLVYHGSKAVFTEYDHSKINSHGSAEGRGFYFTDNLSMAEGYGSETGQVLRGYLNITKPLSLDERTITKAQVRQLLKTVDPSGDDVILNFDPMGGMGYPSKAWYDRSLREAVNTIHEYNDNDADLLAEIANSGAGDKMVMLAARELFGYDGYIAKGKYDDATVYVAFDSDQFKNADNTKPTKSKDFRYSVDDTDGIDDDRSPEEKKKPSQKRKKDTKPVAESLPLIAKKDLRWTVTSLFSIPDGQRAELGAVIDGYADRLIKNGTLTEEDRQAFFDRMYESGVMTVPANDHYAEARNYLKGGKIYVSDSVVEDFGDDWGDIRRRAFAAGIYLTRSQISGGHNVTGIDSWNADLAEDLPGLFNSDETDQRIILERIVQVAEEGRDENLSLAEYTARLAERESISEDEFLDNMERQLDWALRTFAEKARLEVHLRDRTGKKITQEREGFAARTSKMRIKEAQRRADERQDRKNAAERAKARRELSEMQQKTMKQLRWLNKNRNRAPEELRAIWDEVLGDIDLYAVSAANELNWSEKYNATWKDLAQMYKDAQKNDPNFMPSKELERIVARLDGTKIGEMDVGALQDLYKAAIGLRTEFYNRNNVINDEMHRLFAEVYSDSKREIQAAPGGFKGSKVDKFFNMDQLTPMNVLERMGGWDPNGAFYSMAKQLEKGERDQRAYTVKAQKMLQEFLEEHEDWVKKADGQGKDAVWYEVEVPELLELHMGDKPIFGDTAKVYMTPAQKVHLYLESKNLDNLRHMTGGRTFVDKDLYSKGKRQEALAQGKTIRLAPETVRALVNDLTAEEMELAQLLDRYYNGFATQEINKVSNVLHGYDKAMGKNYAPIYTNRNYTKSEFGVFDSTAEGVGNLKERQRSANPSYNISCFDAFERHVDQTARFCGMAIPTRNWTQLMNWRERDNSTADVISHKWGDEGKKYIADLINTLQGGDDGKSDTVSSVAGKLQSNYISAIFGANPSIVLKQLGSIPLAGAYLGAGNMPNPAQIARIDRGLIQKYTQELEWRTMGYTTPETKFLKENPNWTQTNKAFKFLFGGGAITAMDGWAASTLWPWAENKVRKEHPDLEVGTQEQIDNGESPFYKKVAEEFDNAVSRSQSVSDEIHQGTMRKSKNPIARAFTLFRSDSAQSYNALRQKVGEARFLAKNGSGKGAVKAAKIAVGVTFGAILINAAWAEAISFLMALWKNKGKKYRDDEEELTAQSVIGEIVTNMMGSLAGVTIGGEELFELVGNILTGDTWYGIDTPGMEQLNDMLDAIVESGGDIRELVTGAWDVFQNGGDLGEYFRKNSGKLLGCIKEIAETTATYMTGLPAGNVEAYLIGALKWVSPELGAAYDDTFSEVGKSDLAGTEGDALASRVGRILADRKVSDSDETAQVLATLYEEGYKAAVPSDTPSSISINGESRTLSPYQQQTYDAVWGSIVSDGLDELVSSDAFAEADAETQEKMLKNLYSYAAEQAKATLFDDYELDSGAAKNAAIISAGASVAECIIWNATTSDMDSGEKSAELATWDLPEITKRAIFYRKISDSREEEISAFTDAGLTFDQFLVAYSKYGEINGMDLSASEKAVKFSYWVDGQNYTSKQANVVKDELVFYGMTPAGAGNYDKFSDAGMGPEDALGLSDALGGLEPEAGSDRVTNTQKWRACVDYYDDTDDQLTALYAVMTPTQYQKVEIAYDYGVSPDSYVTLQEILPDYDVDGNGAYKQDEVTAAIEGMPGSYTKTQKAVMWQLATGSKSAKNNPYSKKVGQQVIDARESAGDSEDKTFSQEVQDQMQGRG